MTDGIMEGHARVLLEKAKQDGETSDTYLMVKACLLLIEVM
jgi:hypothetical protein